MTVGFIGCGNMGTALIAAISEVPECTIKIYDVRLDAASAVAEKYSAEAVASIEEAAVCELVFLAVKPNIIETVCKGIKDHLSPHTTVVSIAAGITVSTLSGFLERRPIIRIMPNTPALVGEGMITWAKNERVGNSSILKFKTAMARVGRLDEIDERLMDAATAVAGCGPAFVYMFAEALADGAVACGLPRDKALAYATQTIKGAAEMIEKTGKHPERLKDEVCSPGGSTIEGVRALEDCGMRGAVMGAVIAAYEKTKKLG